MLLHWRSINLHSFSLWPYYSLLYVRLILENRLKMSFYVKIIDSFCVLPSRYTRLINQPSIGQRYHNFFLKLIVFSKQDTLPLPLIPELSALRNSEATS